MLKKILWLGCFIIFLLPFLIPSFVYSNSSNPIQILTLGNTSFTPGSSFSIEVDFSSISIKNLKIVITPNFNLGEPVLEDSLANEMVQTISNSCFVMQMNPEELNCQKLVLAYTVPEDFKVGNQIEFLLEVYQISTNSETDILEETLFLENTVSCTVTSNSKEDSEQKEDPLTPDPDFSNSQENPKDSNIMSQNQVSSNSKINEFVSALVQVTSPSLKTISALSSQVNSKVETVSYEGSSNNSLSSLSIRNYDFTKTFSKTNLSYFTTVPNEITSIDVNAIVEDSTANVCIYGNTDLMIGTNKVLITVTAENGSTKTYRIYVTRNS